MTQEEEDRAGDKRAQKKGCIARKSSALCVDTA